MAIGGIHLFLGSEIFLIENKIQRLLTEAGVDEYNTSYYDLDEEPFLDALHDALMMPFICDVKAVILKNPLFLSSEKSLLPDEKKQFLKYLERPMESTIFIINAAKITPDERKAEVKRLMSDNIVNYSKELTEIEMYGWIKRQAALNNMMITDEAVKEFYGYVGKNLMNAKNELDKLFAYARDEGIITVDVVSTVVVKEIQNDVFALSNAIIGQDRPQVIAIYQELIQNGYDSGYLFNLISKSMRELLVVNTMLKGGRRQADIAGVMGVSSGRAYFMVKNARALNYQKTSKYVAKLCDLDYKIKSGQTDVNTALEFFLFGV